MSPVLEHLSICNTLYKKNAFHPLFLPLCFSKYFPVKVLMGVPNSNRMKGDIACEGQNECIQREIIYLVKMLNWRRKYFFYRNIYVFRQINSWATGRKGLYSLSKTLFNVRHALNTQIYRRKLICFQRDILYGDFGSHRAFRI